MNNKIRKHIKPPIGRLALDHRDLTSKIDGMFATLRRCREHCQGDRSVELRIQREHQCDGRRRIHECAPLGGSMQQEIHTILNQAFDRAVKVWGWLPLNPDGQDPPAERATASAAASDGVTGSEHRSGGIPDPALGRPGLAGHDLRRTARRTVRLAAWRPRRRRHPQDQQVRQAKRFSNHRGTDQDPPAPASSAGLRTVGLLRTFMAWAEQQAAALGLVLDDDCYLFSPSANGREPLHPDTVTSHFDALTQRLGIRCTFHKLRHYSATELILAGVGRLCHSGGGATTLRAYTAWVSEADQRAAKTLAPRMPIRVDDALAGASARVKANPQNPYEVVAVALFKKIMSGELSAGATLPTQKELCLRHQISDGTAARVFDLLKKWGAVEVTRGLRATVASGIPGQQQAHTAANNPSTPSTANSSTDAQLMCLTARVDQDTVHELLVEIDPSDSRSVQHALQGFAESMSDSQRQTAHKARCIVEVQNFTRQDVVMRMLLPRPSATTIATG